ncbi:hypothetical protein LJR234_000068 [Mesorhizobium amorphae]|uniref:hypothetical protein n=1 Tax=Mesorhizobium amorphae TaxID=71433 RepID=UPI003ECC6359
MANFGGFATFQEHQQQAVGLVLALVLALECVEVRQPAVPVSFQRICDPAVVRIDLQVAPAGQFILIAGALQCRRAGPRPLHVLGDFPLHASATLMRIPFTGRHSDQKPDSIVPPFQLFASKIGC